MMPDYSNNKRAVRQLRRQGGMCFLCGEPLDITDCTRDHFIPKSKGGRPGWDNVVMAHADCNYTKGDELPGKEDLERFNLAFGTYPAGHKALRNQEATA